MERLRHFFLTKGITDEAKQLSILSVCGAKTYTLKTPQRTGQNHFVDLVPSDFHNPKPPEVQVESTFFGKHVSLLPTLFDELHQLPEHCEFGAVLEDMLRGSLVCGIIEDSIQCRLLGGSHTDFQGSIGHISRDGDGS